MYGTFFEVKFAFDLYKHYVVSCKAFYYLTNTSLVVNIQCNIDQWINEQNGMSRLVVRLFNPAFEFFL